MIEFPMTLEEILFHLDENKIRYLYNDLKDSKDPKCEYILIKIIQGQDLYSAIGSQTDRISQVILSTKKPSGLMIIGKYIYLKKSMMKKLYSSISYPLLLCFLLYLSMIAISYMIKINYLEIVIAPLLILGTSAYFFNRIIKKFYEIIKTQLVLEFLNNKINFEEISKIWLIFGNKIERKQFINIEEIIFKLTDKHLNYLNLEQFYKEESINFNKFCDDITEKNGKIGLILMGLFISYCFFKSMSEVFKDFI